MKAKKLLALAGVSIAGAFLLAACGGGSSKQATYSLFIRLIQIPWITLQRLVQQLQISLVTWWMVFLKMTNTGTLCQV